MASWRSLGTSQQNQVKTLIFQYGGVFACGNGNSGRTKEVKYKTDTGAAKPIRQIAIEEAQKIIQKMEREPSSSPWV